MDDVHVVHIPITPEESAHLTAVYGPDWPNTRRGMQTFLVNHIQKLHRKYGVLPLGNIPAAEDQNPIK